MKVYKATEDEIDKRLKLDKRHDKRAFCRNFGSEDELPAGFYDLQDTIRNGLEKEFVTNFDDGIDRSEIQLWKLSGSYTLFYFPAELIISERIIIEMSNEILGNKLIALIWSYLEKCPSRYCVIGAVFRGELKGSNYIGRFVMNEDEIAVEESLCSIWSQQVTLMEMENMM